MATKRVSAGTITTITSAAGFHDPAKPQTAPTAEQLTQSIRDRLQKQIDDIKSGKLSTFNPAGGAMKMPVEAMLQRATENLNTFNTLLKDVPQGFKLVPVYYSKVAPDVNERLHKEYVSRVRHRFLEYLAEHHADELRALGIAECGIDRMKRGFDPVDPDGKYYDVNVDHVIERSGCGLWATQRTRDPLQASDVSEKHPVNHFDNLMLMPEDVHEFKNKLNDVQKVDKVPTGGGLWMLMMVAEETPSCSGYVCPPQDPQHAKYALKSRAENLQARMGRLSWAIDRIEELLDKLVDHPVAKPVLSDIYDVSHQMQQPVTAICNMRQKRLQGQTPRQAFNRAVANDNDLKGMIDNRLRPLIRETETALSRTFNGVAKKARQGHQLGTLNSFDQYFHGKVMAGFRARINDLPVDEAIAMERTMKEISREIGALKSRGQKNGKKKHGR